MPSLNKIVKKVKGKSAPPRKAFKDAKVPKPKALSAEVVQDSNDDSSDSYSSVAESLPKKSTTNVPKVNSKSIAQAASESESDSQSGSDEASSEDSDAEDEEAPNLSKAKLSAGLKSAK